MYNHYFLQYITKKATNFDFVDCKKTDIIKPLKVMKSFAYLFICLSVLPAFSACTRSQSSDSLAENDSILCDSNEIKGIDTIVWAPLEFKEKHPEEWNVVNKCISIQQMDARNVNYTLIDKCVQEYINTMGIEMPVDALGRINQIEEICTSKFDISEYDLSNMGMNIADGTAILFKGYISWLLEKEVFAVSGNGINVKEENLLLDSLMNAFRACSEPIEENRGSSSWMAANEVTWIGKNFRKSMYESILSPKPHEEPLPLLLTPENFEDECRAHFRFYRWRIDKEPSFKERIQQLQSYFTIMKKWLEFREKTEIGIPDPVLKADYNYMTRTFARTHFIHLKNYFEDFGIMSPSQIEMSLSSDCTDEEMLNFSYEKALESQGY